MHVIPIANDGPRLSSWITQANLGIQHCTREIPSPRKHSGFGMTRARLQLKARRPFDFRSDEVKSYRQEFITG